MWQPQASSLQDVPLTGLAQAPTVLAGEAPIQLVNFTQDEQTAIRDQAISSGAASGAVSGGLGALSFPPVMAACFILPPLCVGVVGASAGIGAATGGASGGARVGEVSPEASDRLGVHFRSYPSSSSLQRRLAESLPAPEPGDGPRLIVNIAAVGMLPNEYGIRFVVKAEVRCQPSPGTEWAPSTHFVWLPVRPVKDWLADDGKLVRNEYDEAIATLAANIRSVYLPTLP